MPSKKNINRPTTGRPVSGRRVQRTNAIRSRTQQRPTTRNQRRRTAAQRGNAIKGAQNQLKQFRQATILTVAITGFLMMFLTPGEAGYSQEEPTQQEVADSLEESTPDSVSIIEKVAVDELVDTEMEEDSARTEGPITQAAKDEAIHTLQGLWESFYANLPKILVAIGALLLAWLFTRFLRFVLHKILGHWERANATITLIIISVWLFAIGIALSVVAGDIRALVGSLGLIGLALSWSLQTPIESFTGWLLNSFRGYYRVGDRISVGEVFGDVYKIDFLTTTVWEIGAPYRSGFVQAEQPTGRLVTFPNNEILSGTVVNLTGDFPYVWDELAISIANESDLRLAQQVIQGTAETLLSGYMQEPAHRYASILLRAGLQEDVPDKPQAFVSINESWTDIIVRYLVGARERRKWKSELSVRIIEELGKEEYQGKIISVYPRQQFQFINPKGNPIDPPGSQLA